MKKVFTLAAFCCIFAIAATAQKAPDFSGTWTLDVSKSQLGERNRIEGMTMTVVQTAKDVKVTTETKRQAPPADAAAAGAGMGRPGGGGGMGRGFGGSDTTNVYTLDGKETTIEVDGPNGKMPMKLKGLVEAGGKATFSTSRTFNSPNGEVTFTTKEAWSLAADGKTLTVIKEQASMRGTNSTTMVFVKK
ncbi:MAG: hypothetical protein ABI539_05280 [Acidobacteriota bacterium]